MSKSKKAARLYVGPAYVNGIKVPGEQGLIRPRDFSEKQIDAFIKKFPDREDWWEQPQANTTSTDPAD